MRPNRWRNFALNTVVGVITRLVMRLLSGSLLAWTIAGLGLGLSWAVTVYGRDRLCL